MGNTNLYGSCQKTVVKKYDWKTYHEQLLRFPCVDQLERSVGLQIVTAGASSVNGVGTV